MSIHSTSSNNSYEVSDYNNDSEWTPSNTSSERTNTAQQKEKIRK